jgi:hypothetical protein
VGPQLYWTTTSTGQPFGALLDWWTTQASTRSRWLMPALNVSKMGTTGWELAEFRAQFSLLRAANPKGATGTFLYSAKTLNADLGGLGSMIRSEFWNAPALPPALATAKGATFAPPNVAVSGGAVTLTHGSPGDVRGYAIYSAGSAPALSSWVRRTSGSVTLAKGTWAISAIDRRGVESKGVQIVVP